MSEKLAEAAGSLKIGEFEVGRMAFGAMRITGKGIWREPRDPEEARAVLRRAVELGVDFIDTADSYGPEVSERLIGEVLHPYDGVVIATKGGMLRDGPGRWRAFCTPEHLREACEGSLRRLKVEAIDLYQLHTVDRRVPYEASIGALKSLQDEGKIKHVGVSNVNQEQLRVAQSIVEVVSVQNRYNLTDRASDGVIDVCAEQEIAFLPWYPLAVGDLAKRGGVLDDIAGRHDATPGQIALAWLLHRSPVMVPIPGTSSVEHLEENVGAAGLQLTDEDMEDIAAAAG
jgi:aryl-alcohol dehydrogenase-like predicted oxidoreductase